jgi:pyridoxal/pyridoxine/pyridoxamine kinase
MSWLVRIFVFRLEHKWFTVMYFIGYIGNYAILEKIKNMVQKLKKKNPNLIYGELKIF